MEWEVKLFLRDDKGEKIFGRGPLQLLKKIEETGSLHQGAKEMNMAYSKAIKLVKNAEEAIGSPLTIRTAGGRQGGGSILTKEAKTLIKEYENMEKAVEEFIKER